MNITYKATKLETPENKAIVQLDTTESLYVVCGCNVVHMHYTPRTGWRVDYCNNVTAQSVSPKTGFLDTLQQDGLASSIYNGYNITD